MLAKDSVQIRLDRGLSFTEFSYMLLQAADFLHLYRSGGVELQMGGADQWGNITAGLELIRRRGVRRGAGGDLAFGLGYPLLTDAVGREVRQDRGRATVWLDPALTSPYRFYQYWLDADDRDVGQLPALVHPLRPGRDRGAGGGAARPTPSGGSPSGRSPGTSPSGPTAGRPPSGSSGSAGSSSAATRPRRTRRRSPSWPGDPRRDLAGRERARRGRRARRQRGGPVPRRRAPAARAGRRAGQRPAGERPGDRLRPPETSWPGATSSSGGASASTGCSCAGDGRRVMVARGHVQVISGCMYSGKTDELLRLLRRAEIARQRILLVRPALDDRTEPETVRSRSGAAYHSKAVADPADIESLAKDGWADVIAIEEAQFFPPAPGRRRRAAGRRRADRHRVRAEPRLPRPAVRARCPSSWPWPTG